MHQSKFTIAISFFIFLLISSSVCDAQLNISVISDEAVIYQKPDTTSSIQLNVQKGDIFEVQNIQGNWIQINLFSGDKRYVKDSQVEFINVIPSYPSAPSTRNKLCMEAEKAHSKASRKAISDYPENTNRQATYEKILFDDYMLNNFRRFNIPASHYSKLVECVNDPLPPQPIRLNSQD